MPFAGWHVHSEEPDQLIVLAADPRVRESTEALAAVGFARVELASRQLTAIWPDFPWETEDDQGEGDSTHQEGGRRDNEGCNRSVIET